MRIKIIAAGLIAVSLLLRLIQLNADPPTVFPNGFRVIEPFTDEAAKSYQARNRALFGQWNTSEQDQYRYWKKLSPVWCYPLWWWFEILGVNYASLRLFSVFWFGIGFILIYFALRKNPGDRAPVYALFFYGVNFYLLLFSRLGLMETMLNSFFLLSFMLLCSSLERKWFFPMSILAFLASYFIKQNALLLAPVFAAGYFFVFGSPWRRKFWMSAANGVSVILIVLGAAVLYHLWTEPAYRLYTVLNFRHGYGLPPASGGLTIRPDMMKASLIYHLSLAGLWQNFFAYDPVAAGLAVIDLAAVLYFFVRKRETAKVEILAGVWLLSIQALLLLSSARVVRFWILQLPAVIILAAAALNRIQTSLKTRGKRSFAPAGIVLLASFLFNFQPWLNWQLNAQYQAADNSQKLAQALGEKETVVVGKWAGPLLMPTRHRYYYIKIVFNRKPEQLRNFGINYILLGDVPALTRFQSELENDPYLLSFRAAFPAAFAQKQPVINFKFYDSDLTLYKVDTSLDRP